MHRQLAFYAALATLPGSILFFAPPAAAQDSLEERIEEKVEEALEERLAEEIGIKMLTEFAGSTNVTFDEPRDDVFGIAADTLEITAPVSDNAFAIAREVILAAPLGGDLLAMGEILRIESQVGGDVYAAAGKVEVDDGGGIAGDLYGAGGKVILGGPVAGDVMVGAGKLVIDSVIAGDVLAEVGDLEFGDAAQIAGDLTYEAPSPVLDAENYVAGTVTFTEQVADDEIVVHIGDGGTIDWGHHEHPHDDRSWAARTFADLTEWTSWRMWGYLSKLLVGFALFALGGVAAESMAHKLREQPAESLGIGFVTMVGMPIASALCIVTIIPIPLGLLGFFAWGALMLLGQVVVAQTIGDLILRQFRPDALGSPYISLAVGLVPLVVLLGMPWLWFMTNVGAAMAGMGAIVMAIREQREQRRAPDVVTA